MPGEVVKSILPVIVNKMPKSTDCVGFVLICWFDLGFFVNVSPLHLYN